MSAENFGITGQRFSEFGTQRLFAWVKKPANGGLLR